MMHPQRRNRRRGPIPQRFGIAFFGGGAVGSTKTAPPKREPKVKPDDDDLDAAARQRAELDRRRQGLVNFRIDQATGVGGAIVPQLGKPRSGVFL
jgi:hypothetical protein